MNKLAVTKAQENALYILRLEGLRRKIELEEATEAYNTAARIEKEVNQYVVDNNVFIADCPEFENENGKRITKEFDTYLLNDDVFMNDYLPKVKAAYKDLHDIDNPLNFVYSSPMRERKHKAEKNYQKLAVDFLKICGRKEEAEKIEHCINTYMKKEFIDRLYELNDNFIGGK